MVWSEVIEALDSIIDDYERVNHLISFQQDDKVRRKGLDSIVPMEGVSVELGSGPGNYSKMVEDHVNDLICLDFSAKMHRTARDRNLELNHHYVRGVFEALPFRSGSTGFITAAYALRDSLDKPTAFNEVHRVLKTRGKFLLVDIGKPDNPILLWGMSLYMQMMVPLIGAVAGGKRKDNPWRILWDTFRILPKNTELKKMVTNLFGKAVLTEHSLGGLVTLTTAKK